MIKYDTASLKLGDTIPCEHTKFHVVKTELSGKTGKVTVSCDYGFFKEGDKFVIIGQDVNDGDIYVNLDSKRLDRYEWYIGSDCFVLDTEDSVKVK